MQQPRYSFPLVLDLEHYWLYQATTSFTIIATGSFCFLDKKHAENLLVTSKKMYDFDLTGMLSSQVR